MRPPPRGEVPETLVRGDPASCSRLGGALRRAAAVLAAVADEERTRASYDGLRRERAAGHPGPALGEEASAAERLRAAADELDRAGRLLQEYATELAHALERAREVERGVWDAGLTLRDGRVLEPWGVAAAEAAADRRRRQPVLQEKAERVTAAVGRARGTLRRGCGRTALRVRELAAGS